MNAAPSRRRRHGVGALLIGGLLLVSGCTSTTRGSGSAVPPSPTPAASTAPPAATTLAPPSSVSASTPPGASPTATAPPTIAERARALRDRVDPQEVSPLVTVPTGFEAAVYDHAGSITFWFDPPGSLSWTQIGSSAYPYHPQVAPDPEPRVVAKRLTHMAHGTFIVRGLFTGDASGNAVAFTTGDNGWGAIKAEASGRIGPSGAPVGADQIGLSYDFGFASGALVTVDCPTDRAQAECGQYPIKKYWLWNGHDFSQQ